MFKSTKTCVAVVWLLGLAGCGLLAPGSEERIAQDQVQFAPLVERAKQDLAAGVPWWQRSGEMLVALAGAIGTVGGIAGTRALRGPADKMGKLKVAAERAAKKAAAA